jgi:hypothetical protein
MIRLHTLVVLLPLLAACTGVADPIADNPASADEGDAEESQDQALGSKPKYTLGSRTILGDYRSTEGCNGGVTECDYAVVRRVGDRLEVELGGDGRIFQAWATAQGVLVFSSGELEGDCDDPGCGNLFKVNGVIYPVKKGNRWVPQLKSTVVVDYPYPEEEDSPSGFVTTVVRYQKR